MPRKARIDAPGALHHIIIKGIERRKIFKDDTDRINFLDRLGKVLTEIGRNISAWKATDKNQSKKPFLLLGGQGIGTNNGGSCPKAQYLAASGQYEYSAWRANSIRKWIFTDGWIESYYFRGAPEVLAYYYPI